MIRIEKKGRRIVISADEPLPGFRTTIPGAYETVTGAWTVPLSLETCKLLRQKFGRRLKVGNELRRWAHGVRQSREYMTELASAEDARLNVLSRVAPRLAKAMRRRKYQRVGARFIADNTATLVADEPGLGKTLIAMGGILEAEIPGPYLVVAPKTASDSVWRREIIRWLPAHHKAVTLPQHRYQREQRIRLTRYDRHTWLIVHPEIVMVNAWWECAELITKVRRGRSKRTGKRRIIKRIEACGKRTPEKTKQQRELDCGHIKNRKTKKVIEPSYPKLFQIKWGAIIADESHETLIVRTGQSTQRRRGMVLLPLREDGMKLALSGTPFDSKPHQLWGTLNWLDPVMYSAFHRWSEMFWQKGGYTGFEIGEFMKEREEMLWDSLSAIALRRTKAEVAADLPPKTYVGTPLDPKDPTGPVGVWLEMDGKQAKAYDDMEKLSVAELKSGRLEAISALAELTRLKQLACAYGDIFIKTVRVKCQDLPGYKEDPWICKSCRRKGYHLEDKDFYRPALPSNKYDWIVENLEEWGYPKNPLTKVVIVSFYTGILEVMGEALEKHFKVKNPLCAYITGNTPSHERRGIIDRFNRDDNEHVMLLNVKAGGTAITIDSADRMIFISETRIPDQQKQAEDRIHRISNPRKVMYYYLRSLGTVDVGTALMNQEMIQDTHRLLDGRRGVAYLREVVNLSHRRYARS